MDCLLEQNPRSGLREWRDNFTSPRVWIQKYTRDRSLHSISLPQTDKKVMPEI